MRQYIMGMLIGVPLLVFIFLGLSVDYDMENSSKKELYEIRDYTIEREWFDKYVYWAENYFIPFAKDRIDIIDFWVDKSIEAEVSGTNPIISPNGQPNITWIARYSNKDERDSFFESLKIDEEWAKVWSMHPNPDAYIHENARFFKSIK